MSFLLQLVYVRDERGTQNLDATALRFELVVISAMVMLS